MTTRLIVGLFLIVQVGLVQLLYYDEGSGDNKNCPHNCVPQKGENGHPGPDSAPGPDGDLGRRGDPGRYPSWFHWHTFRVKGDKGVRGRAGSDGTNGSKGDKGSPGQDGRTGLPGDPGPRGNPGIDGDTGDSGNSGSVGERGEKGEEGTKGFKGDTGAKGQKGDKGADSSDANRGSKGDAGDPGEDGLPGPAGDTGTPGDKGNPGIDGVGGFSGRVGDPGVQGPDGPQGDRGDRGDIRDKGSKGEKGEPGGPIITSPKTEEVCNEENEGKIYFDPDTNVLYFCDGKTWQCTSGRICNMKCTYPRDNTTLNEGEEIYREETEESNRNRPASDIVILVDNSDTMIEAHPWITNAAKNLEQVLLLSDVGTRPGLENLYSVVVFGAGETQIFEVNGKKMYGAAGVETAINGLRGIRNESILEEDGYHAIEVALRDLPLRSRDKPNTFALNMVMITDERRATTNRRTNSTREEILEKLQKANVRFNLIANIDFRWSTFGNKPFGVDYRGIFYIPAKTKFTSKATNGFRDGSGGVTAQSEWCNVYRDYAQFAMDTRGAVWDLEVIYVDETRPEDEVNRQKLTLDSFNQAVIHVKAREILEVRVCVKCICKDVGKKDTGDAICTPMGDQDYCFCRAVDKRSHEVCRSSSGGRRTPGTGSTSLPWTTLLKDCDAREQSSGK